MDDVESQPRAFVAHQQMHDLFLLALLSTHPDPETVMHRFRKLVDDLTSAGTWLGPSGPSFLAAVQRSATRFDQLATRLLPAAGAPALDVDRDRARE